MDRATRPLIEAGEFRNSHLELWNNLCKILIPELHCGLVMAKEYDGDPQLDEAFRTVTLPIIGQGVCDIPDYPDFKPVKTEEYKVIASTFALGMRRTVSLWLLPSELIYWTAFHSWCTLRMRLALGLKETDASKDGSDEALEIYRELLFTVLLPSLAPGTASFRHEVFRMGSAELKKLVGREKHPPPWFRAFLPFGPIISEGVESILSTMVMSSYGVFETMAVDLWEAAVNRNDKLADAYLESKKNGKDGKNEMPIGSDLLEYGHNLTGKIGTLYLDRRKPQSFGEIKKWYIGAFGSVIESVLVNSKDVVEAEQVRHLFAHRGGIVDSKFLKSMKDYPAYQNLKIDDRLELDGPTVRRHVNACIECGTSLFRFVDNWTP
jgi:hypothetical protein